MAWNTFKYCTGLKILGSIMILVVLAIVGLTYYAMVLATYGPQLAAGGQQSVVAAFVLVVFHGLLTMLLWSYFAVVVTDPGGIPPDWHPHAHEDDLEAQVQTLATLPDRQGTPHAPAANPRDDVSTPHSEHRLSASNASVRNSNDDNDEGCASDDPHAALVGSAGGRMESGGARGVEGGAGGVAGGQGRVGQQQQQQQLRAMRGMGVDRDGRVAMSGRAADIRRCKRCLLFKPPRAHHCSVCGRCILKMDHHCVWVINCVGAKNYKFFLLFLFYTFVETAVVSIALLPHFINFFTEPPNDTDDAGRLAVIFLSFVLNLAFTLSLLGFLIMHLSLVAGNTTTIEAFEKRGSPRWRFDVGRRRNFEQVFGAERRLWFVPMYSAEDLRRIPALHGLEFPENSEFSSEFEVPGR